MPQNNKLSLYETKFNGDAFGDDDVPKTPKSLLGTQCEAVPFSPNKEEKNPNISEGESFQTQMDEIRGQVTEQENILREYSKSFYGAMEGVEQSKTQVLLLVNSVEEDRKNLALEVEKMPDKIHKQYIQVASAEYEVRIKSFNDSQTKHSNEVNEKVRLRLGELNKQSSQITSSIESIVQVTDEVKSNSKSENEALSSKLNVLQKKVEELEYLNTTLATEAQAKEITRSEEIVNISDKISTLSIRQLTLHYEAIKSRNLLVKVSKKIMKKMGIKASEVKEDIEIADAETEKEFITCFLENEHELFIPKALMEEELYPNIQRKVESYYNNNFWNSENTVHWHDTNKETNLFHNIYNMGIITKDKAMTCIPENLQKEYIQYLDSLGKNPEALSPDAQKPDSEKNFQMSVAEGKHFPEPDPKQNFVTQAVQQRALQSPENPEVSGPLGEGQDLDVTVSGDIGPHALDFGADAHM